MRFAFMDGGMATNSPTTEPTTGNEVPPGSMEEEVKDDIEAEIPEGAYVLPANVVQFYGKKYFINMIEKARKEMAGGGE